MAVAAASVLVVTASGEASAASGIPSSTSDVPTAIFAFKADEGAHPVGGRFGEWIAPDSEIMVWEHENILKIDAEDETGFDYIRVELNAPGHAPLEVGSYSDVRNQDTDGSPGMRVISGGLSCGDTYGEFVIDRIERNPTTQTLVGLDARFTQRCTTPDGPALHGRIHYQP